MSFYDDASLVFLPSGGAGKDTKAYSIKPTDGSGDFTFSRGGNLTATRVDSNGFIEKGRENLLLQSNQFDTTWSNNLGASGTIADNQSGYDGSNDAWLLTKDATTFARVQQTLDTPISGVWTMSAYLKAGTATLSRFRFNSASYMVEFNFSTGIATDEGSVSAIDFGMTDVGNGWYRCYATFNASVSIAQIYVDYNTSTSTTMFIQDAQLEIGLVATEYIESGASTGKAGILEDSPRFDYSGGASCPSLLLEPQRGNNVPYSEYFEAWDTIGTITITSNYGISPEGVKNSTRVQFSGASHELRDVTSVSAGNVSTIYIKGTSGETIKFGSTGSEGLFTLNGDWQRIERYNAGAATKITLNTYGGVTARDVEVWGAMQELGGYPTSYIPNHSGGSVTREADECTKTSISGLIGQTEGTIYCEFEYNGAADSGVFNRIIGLGTGVTQNRILLAKNDTTAELVAFAVTGGTTQVFQAIAGTSIIGHHKVAISYKANEYKVYLDGELEFTDTSASVPATTDVYIGTAEDGTTNNELGGIVKESIIYKEVLSEDNCKALTTL